MDARRLDYRGPLRRCCAPRRSTRPRSSRARRQVDAVAGYDGGVVFDVVISHNRYTLVDSSAESLLVDAAERGVAFVNAAPYGGGVLVRGPEKVPTYAYQPTDDETLARVATMQRLCEEHDVPLAAAALQFSMRDPRVASTIVGMSSPERVAETVRLAEHPIGEELWARLEPLAAQGRAGVGR